MFNRLRADYLRRTAVAPNPDPAPSAVVVEQVPAWLEMVELAASVTAERAAPRRVVGEHVPRTHPEDVDGAGGS